MSDRFKFKTFLESQSSVKLTEAKHVNHVDFYDALDDLIDHEKIDLNGFNAGSGLEELVGFLDDSYSSLDDFFGDNPGAAEAVLEWIRQEHTKEWENNIVEYLTDERVYTKFDSKTFYSKIANHVDAPLMYVQDFFEGGGGNGPGWKEFLKELESSGYNTDGSVDDNFKWFKMIGFKDDEIEKFDEYLDDL